MSYVHLASNANSSSPTPSSFLHINSNGGVSTVPSPLTSNSSSLFGSVGSGKPWITTGQSASSSSSANSNNSLPQQLLMKQQHLLNNPTSSSLSSSGSSSHLESILGVQMSSAFGSSSQNQMEKKFELQQEDFPPLPHRSLSHDPNSSSSGNIPSLYQSQYSSTPTSSNHHSSMSNGFSSTQTEKFSTQQQQQQQQPTVQHHPQSQSPLSFKSSADAFNSLLNRNPGSINSKPSTLSNNSANNIIGTQSLSNPSSSSTSTNNLSTASIINTNGLPSSTINDQYGLAGLVQLIHQAEKNPETATLLNFDLTSLGLSMESPNELYPSFLSPFSENQARPHEIDYQVPIEYQMGIQIRDKLPQINFNTLNEDTLFFLFYVFGNDQVQLLAAAELYRRDWRYHKDEKIWLTRIKNILPDQKCDIYETGVYCVFDFSLWRKTHKSMRIDYEKLDGNHVMKQQDILAPKLLQQQTSVQQQQQPYGSVSSYTNNTAR